MNQLSRRAFVGTGVVGTILASGNDTSAAADSEKSDVVQFRSDGLILSPDDYVGLLTKLVKGGQANADRYLTNGCVATLEERFAKALGKERAIFLPTGTLANHLALRCQSQGKSRVLVQAESHIYRDSLDCVQTLSHLNLVPLAPDTATVSLAQVEEEYRRATDRPFPLQVGVISLENPVRRRLGETFDLNEMKKIAVFARKHDIRMHLDGARLWVASAYTGVSPVEYAALFDTVYVSLYKSFNAGTGAILAGPRAVIEQVAQARKVFGGGLYQAWPYAAVALHYLDGFAGRFQKAVRSSQAMFALLEKHPRFRVEVLPQGTNIVKLHVKDVDGAKYQAALKKHGVSINDPNQNFPGFLLVINETINRRTPEELAKAFVAALGN